jgi:hypothetical protein
MLKGSILKILLSASVIKSDFYYPARNSRVREWQVG